MSEMWKRFAAKIEFCLESDGCWIWKGSRDGYGYGMFRVSPKKVRRAHRVSWEFAHGPVSDGTVFLHSCDNPPCVNPAHLSIGSRAENNEDRDAKGRHWTRVGEDHGRAKLTEEAVREIRSLPRYARVAHLAEKYGVSVGTIHQVRYGRTWKEVAV